MSVSTSLVLLVSLCWCPRHGAEEEDTEESISTGSDHFGRSPSPRVCGCKGWLWCHHDRIGYQLGCGGEGKSWSHRLPLRAFRTPTPLTKRLLGQPVSLQPGGTHGYPGQLFSGERFHSFLHVKCVAKPLYSR